MVMMPSGGWLFNASKPWPESCAAKKWGGGTLGQRTAKGGLREGARRDRRCLASLSAQLRGMASFCTWRGRKMVKYRMVCERVSRAWLAGFKLAGRKDK